MRILHFLSDSFGGHGGIARFNRDFLNALVSSSAVSEIVALPRWPQVTEEKIPEKIEYRRDVSGSLPTYLAASLAAAVSRKRFETIICSHINLLPMAALAAKTHRARLILVIYGIDAWHPSRKSLLQRCLPRVDVLVSISDFTTQRFLKWANVSEPQQIHLPPTIDTQRFTPGPKSQELIGRYGLANKKVIVTLARLDAREKWKGVDEILEALPKVLSAFPDLVYLICGDGTDRNRLEEKAKNLGLEASTRFVGVIAEEEKVDHYRIADAYVMPSRAEGFGIVFLEAIACGLPILASAIDAGREVVALTNAGIAVNPEESDEISDAICQLLSGAVASGPHAVSDLTFEHFQRRTHALLAGL